MSSFIVIAILLCAVGLLQWRSSRSPANSDPSPDTRAPQVSPPTSNSASPSAILKPAVSDAYCSDPHTITCNSKFPSYDPTGQVRSDVAGEIRALRYMRDIIHKNPGWTSEQVQESLIQSIYTDTRRKVVEDGFVWVLQNMQALIKEQPSSIFSDEEKQALLERLSQTQLDLPPTASYADAPDLVTKNTVYYERIRQEIFRLRLGGAYLLNTTSWYNVIFTLGHELAHAIDPCESATAHFRPKIYDNLISCFVDAGWVESTRTVCGPDEQVSEVFADWIASELVSRSLREKGKAYSADDKVRSAVNATHDLCAQTGAGDTLNANLHQQPEIRIGGILGKNPTLRKTLECEVPTAKPRYCTFKSLSSMSSPEKTR